MAFLDLEHHLVFYGTYHMHPKNVSIHIVFVPILMFTMFSIAANFPVPLPPSLSSLFPAGVDLAPYCNVSTLVATIYGSLYALMEPVAGSLLGPFVVLQSLVGSYYVHRWGADFNRWAGIVQVVSWIAQFIGHGVYEKKAPALLDNLVQALFLAPLFVWIEVLFMFGYRPELRQRMEEKVKVARAKLDAKKKNGGKEVEEKEL